LGKITLIALFEFILLLGAAYGISTLFIKPGNFRDRQSYLILGISLGLGLISYLTLLAASIHILNLWLFWGIIVFGNILLIKNRAHLTSVSIRLNTGIFGLILMAFVGLNLFYSLFPPSFYDSMMYHLAIPQFYLQQGGIVPWNGNFNSNLPLNGEMLFMFSMLGGTILIPKLLSFWSGIAILILMLRWNKNQFSPTRPLLPLLLFYSVPQIGFLSSSSKPDMLGLLFLFSGFYLLMNVPDHPKSTSSLWLAGFFLGASVGTKYIFAFYIAALVLAFLLFSAIPMKKKISAILVVSIMIGLCLLPWLIKNTVIADNPVYPYFNTLFKSEHWSPEQSRNFSSALKRGERHGLLDSLYYPMELFTKPYRYGWTAVWGILFLIALPFLFFTHRNSKTRMLIFSSLLGFLLLMLFARVPRYFLSSLLLLSLPVAAGIEKAVARKKTIGVIVVPIIISLLILNLALQIDLQETFFKGFQYLKLKTLKKEANIEYLNVIPYHGAARFINRYLTHSQRIMLLGEDRTFYIKKPFLAYSFADKHPLVEMLKTGTNPELIKHRLIGQHISHLLYSEKGLNRLGRLSRIYKLSDSQTETLHRLLDMLKPVYRDRRYMIYRLNW
jgi:4-amino-4-deoxy-L-arabinose transferase-like glycosyltransferase